MIIERGVWLLAAALVIAGCDIDYRCDRLRECALIEDCEEDKTFTSSDEDCINACIDSEKCSGLAACMCECRGPSPVACP